MIHAKSYIKLQFIANKHVEVKEAEMLRRLDGTIFGEAVVLKLTKFQIFALLGALCAVNTMYAASDDWSSRWSPSEGRVNTHLTQANLIKLAESDYYDNVGKTTVNSTTNIAAVNNISNIAQNTNAIGSVNTSTNTIHIDGSKNSLNLANTASNTGGINAGITTSTQSGAINGCYNLSVQTQGPGSC